MKFHLNESLTLVILDWSKQQEDNTNRPLALNGGDSLKTTLPC